MTKRALLLLSCLLTACGNLIERESVSFYELPPSSLEMAAAPAQDPVSLRIARPTVSGALGGSRMLVMREENNYQAYPNARWAAPVPVLWRDWLIDAFWRDGRMGALSSDSDGLRSPLELGGNLRALHGEYLDGQATVVIRYDARLIDTDNRRILASRRFESREAAAGAAVPDIVRALGVAADRLAAELVDWTVEQGAE